MIVVIGLIAVGGYGLAYWGVCLVKGKDVSLAQMFNPFGNYPQFAGPFSKWPDIPDSQVFPGGAASSAAKKAGKQAPPSPGPAPGRPGGPPGPNQGAR